MSAKTTTIRAFALPGSDMDRAHTQCSVQCSPKELGDKFIELLHNRPQCLEEFLSSCDKSVVTKMMTERFSDKHFNTDYSYGTPLAHGILSDSPELTKLLLRHGADPTMQPCALRGDRSPSLPMFNHLHFALVRFCKPEVVSLLLDYAPSLVRDLPSCFRFCVLHYASTCADMNLARRMLQDMKEDIDLIDHQNMGRTALHVAITDNNVPVVKMLVEMGASVNVKDQQGRTPLTIAVDRLDPEVVRLLIAAKADVNMADTQGRTPLHQAARKLSVPLVRLLLEAGADTSFKTVTGKLPIDQAFTASQRRASISPTAKNPERARAEVIELLLSSPKSPSRLTEDQFQHIVFCILQYGSEANTDLVLRVLQTNRGHLGVTSKDELPLLHAAMAGGKVDVGMWLLDHGARVKDRDGEGWMAIHHACTASKDVLDCLQLLMQCGASMNDLTPENWSPLWLLLRYGHPQEASHYIKINKHLDLTYSISLNELRQMAAPVSLPLTLFDPKKKKVPTATLR